MGEVRSEVVFEQLFEAARQGDRGAQDELVRRYWSELRKFVTRQSGAGVRRHEEPEDVLLKTMETFLRRIDSFPRGLREAEVRARLFQLAKWELGNAIKRPRLERREASVAIPEMPRSRPSRGPVTRADDLRNLRHLIRRMNREYARVLTCRLVEGLSTAETAREIGISEDNVKQRLRRARDQLAALTTHWRAEERGEGRLPQEP